ncbi:MAG: hypothetical protein KAW56_01365 [Candidatus Marinimicrobia bacterium]|nr:hypothetical protein [Candidatus Neomarinimicrobiota bacterium]
MDKYESILQDSKSRGTSYHIGYGKIVISFWSFVATIIVIWFSLKVALVLFTVSIFLFIWATLQKRAFKKNICRSAKESSFDKKKTNMDDVQGKNRNYYRWTKLQATTLFLFFIILVMCFVWSWWFLAPALLFLVLNGVAYSKRMKSSGRSPATKDIDDVI